MQERLAATQEVHVKSRSLRKLIISLVVLLPVVIVVSGWFTFFKLFAGRLSPPARAAAAFFQAGSSGDWETASDLLAPGEARVVEREGGRVVVFGAISDDQGRVVLPTVSFALRDLGTGRVLADEGLYPRFRTARDYVAVGTSKGTLYLQRISGRWYVRYLWRPTR